MTAAAPVATDPTARKILLVDDEAANLDLLEEMLGRRGYRALVRTQDAREALPLFLAERPDLVLLDLHMPHRSGLEVLADLRAHTPPDDYLPVLVLTADATVAAKQRALGEGAHDFVTKPFVTAEVLLRVRNLLQTRALYEAQRAARAAAERAAARAALLADASRALASALDGETALARFALAVVPAFADACEIELQDAHGGGSRVARAGADDVAGSALEVPLAAGPDVLGRLRLVRAAGAFDADDAALAEELGRRAALAVEHARLFAAARAATEEREHVLAVVAHDLRTPLCAVMMDAEVLQTRAEALAPRDRQSVRRLQRAAEGMNALIEDLLEVTRADRGAMAIAPREHALATVLDESAESLRPLVEAAGLVLRVESPAHDARAVFDDARVRQVLANLVGNAAKFTPSPGTVTIAAELRADACRFVVRDTGTGIPPEQLPHLFGAFWQGTRADRRGLGLGLAIARGIAEAHGGRIWAESAAGAGTTFVLELPARGAAPITGGAVA